MITFHDVVETIGFAIDGAGVTAIVVGLAMATYRYARVGWQEAEGYRRFRRDLGQGILLGLEFLVAADIVRTVAVTPTLEGVLILGLIVLIRTFLSMSLQVELEGRWPWRREDSPVPNTVRPVIESQSEPDPKRGEKMSGPADTRPADS
jgi:uncharacterized membrane protein